MTAKSSAEIDEEMRDTPGRLHAAELLNSVPIIFFKGPLSTELSHLVVAQTWFGLRKAIGDELDRIREFEEALKPFANIALEQDHDKRAQDMISGPDLAITPDEVRRARRTLGEI